jgi:hypothetical protein
MTETRLLSLPQMTETRLLSSSQEPNYETLEEVGFQGWDFMKFRLLTSPSR